MKKWLLWGFFATVGIVIGLSCKLVRIQENTAYSSGGLLDPGLFSTYENFYTCAILTGYDAVSIDTSSKTMEVAYMFNNSRDMVMSGPYIVRQDRDSIEFILGTTYRILINSIGGTDGNPKVTLFQYDYNGDSHAFDCIKPMIFQK